MGLKSPIGPTGEPHLIAKRESVYIRKHFNYHRNGLGHQHDCCLIILDNNMEEVTSCEKTTLWVLKLVNLAKQYFKGFLGSRFQEATKAFSNSFYFSKSLNF